MELSIVVMTDFMTGSSLEIVLSIGKKHSVQVPFDPVPMNTY
jgi:hypothetical protein